MNGLAAAVCSDGDDSARIAVQVVTRAARDELIGLHGGALKVRLSAPPVAGKANAALLAVLAEQLGVRAADCEIVRGQTARHKVVRVHGLTAAQAAARLGA